MTSQITKTGRTIQLVLNDSMQSDQSLWKDFSKHIRAEVAVDDVQYWFAMIKFKSG